MKVAPSLLSCDFANMGKDVKLVTEAGADLIHLDIMDGMFVPNISFGPSFVKAARKYSDLPFDLHLMIEKPKRYINQFVQAGADIITFHIEAESDIGGTINEITKNKIRAGISIKPQTPAEVVFPHLENIYMVQVMTVEPGFGGQSFMYEMMDKVKAIKNEIKKRKLDTLIEVDGGVNEETAKYAANAGVDICVAGTSIFSARDMHKAIELLKNSAVWNITK